VTTDAAIKKSLDLRKRLLAAKIDYLVYCEWHDEVLSGFIKGRLQCELQALEEAARFFGLDHCSQPHRHILLHVLAQAVFGKHKRGALKGAATSWSLRKKILLGMLARELKRQNPRWSSEKIADKICESDRTFKHYREDPSPLRKLIPTAIRELEQFEALYYKAKRTGLKQDASNIESERARVQARLSDPSTRKGSSILSTNCTPNAGTALQLRLA
jgi:hypothetical protein